MTVPDRVLPHSLESERALLGAAMMDPDNVLAEMIAWLGTDEEVFYEHKHKVIYSSLLSLYQSGSRFDPITIGEKLARSSMLDEAGGLPYLTDVYTFCPAISNYRQWLLIVRSKALLRRMLVEATNLAARCYDADADAEAIMAEFGEIVTRGMAKGNDLITHGEALAAGLAHLERIYSDPHGLIGISTGYERLDRYTRGLKEGEFWVLGGPPSFGKTVFGLNVAIRVALAGTPVGMLSMEQSARAVALRSLASGSEVAIYEFPYSASTFAKLTHEQIRQKDAPLYYDDRNGLTVSRACASIRRMVHRHKVRFALVDYLQMMAAENNRASATETMSAISLGLKNLAKELKITVLALSQLNRDSRQAGRRPALHDLKQSGQLEQDADIAILLAGAAEDDDFEGYRVRPTADEMKELIILDIAKNRDGKTDKLPFRWKLNCFRMDEWHPPKPPVRQTTIEES